MAKVKEYFYRRAKEIAEENGFDGYIVEKYEPKTYHSFWGIRPRVEGIILCYKNSSINSVKGE